MDIFLNLVAPKAFDEARTDWKTLAALLAACPGGTESPLASRVSDMLDRAPAVLRVVLTRNTQKERICMSISLRINSAELTSVCEGCITNFTLISECRGTELVRKWNKTAPDDRWTCFWLPLIQQHARAFYYLHDVKLASGCAGTLELLGGAAETHLMTCVPSRNTICTLGRNNFWYVGTPESPSPLRSITYA